MAVPDCVFHRTLSRSRSGSGPNQVCPPSLCRDPLSVVDLQRYSRDQGSSVYFPHSVLQGEDLYDVTLTDGHCRLRATLDPGLNRLVERNVLRPGAVLKNSTFTQTMSAQLPACPGTSYRVLSTQVTGPAPGEEEQEQHGCRRSPEDWDLLPWFGSSEPAGVLVPLRANRSVFLPLWNNVDYSGQVWTEGPPPDEEQEQEEQEEQEVWRPAVSVSQLRDSFLSGRRGVARGVVQHQLIVRIINKSHLMYYGKTDRNCDCPYKAVLQVCDPTGSVCVVLWNSVCVIWYHQLAPGDIISLRRYRVKPKYQSEQDDIEISVNSRNPAARITLLPESSVSPEHLPPAPTYSFCTSDELHHRPHGDVCDVIGLLTFLGRSERIRSQDGKGAELLQYHWLRLEDGTCHWPITVKLFSTSQPETHRKLRPLSVIVCTQLKMIRSSDQHFYLINTTHTQVYCTGLGHHSGMSYRKLRPVRLFLQWLRSQDDGQVLSRALIGGFFMYPPPPVSLETYMKDRRGEPGFLRGAELQREVERLCYRERRSFCIQATVTMVTFSRRGEEERCLFWIDQDPKSSSTSPSPHPSPSPSLSSSPLPLRSPPLSSSPLLLRCPPSSSSSSVVLRRGGRRGGRRRLLQTPAQRRRRPWVTLQQEHTHTHSTDFLFEASMEFLENNEGDEDEDHDDSSSFVTAPLPPVFSPVSMETLPMRYDHAHGGEQAVAVSMEGGASAMGQFDSALQDYYTLRLTALSDQVSLDVVFLPHSSSSLPHSNTWTSILSHGAFSSHSPPPAPADLIAMATQLANQRLVCVLEACHLGGATTEVILSRAFPLTH